MPDDRLPIATEQDLLKAAGLADGPVDHPAHYTKGIECHDFITSWKMDFDTGNVIKYVTRAPYKGQRLQDLLKARWYLDKLIEAASGEGE